MYPWAACKASIFESFLLPGKTLLSLSYPELILLILFLSRAFAEILFGLSFLFPSVWCPAVRLVTLLLPSWDTCSGFSKSLIISKDSQSKLSKYSSMWFVFSCEENFSKAQQWLRWREAVSDSILAECLEVTGWEEESPSIYIALTPHSLSVNTESNIETSGWW